MRIGIDIRTLMDEKYSGIPEYSFSLLNEMFKIDRSNEYVLFYNSFKDLGDRIPDFDYPNVSIVKTNYPSKLFGYILQNIFSWPKLDSLLKVDVFFMPHFNFVALSGDTKSIITIHDLSFLAHPEYFSIKKNIWHKFINIKKTLKKFDSIITISEQTRQDIGIFTDTRKKKITSVYSGISRDFRPIDAGDKNLELVKRKYDLPDKFILCLGTIEPRKNIDGLIKAYDLLIKEKPGLSNTYLVIAGARGWKYKRILKAWERSINRDKIIFTAYIDREDKVYLYNLSELFVYPSFYEGFGFPPLEAMACGIATVASANSSMSEVLGSAAVFVDPYNIVQIKQAIKQILESSDLKSELVKKGIGNAKKYNWEKTAQKTLALIQN